MRKTFLTLLASVVLAVTSTAIASAPAAAEPEPVTWTAVMAGRLHSCGVTSDGAASCWGTDAAGQLGNGSDVVDNQWTPSSVRSPAGIKWASVAPGFDHTCGVTTVGAGYCWGNDDRGKLGNGADVTGTQHEPSPVVTPPGVAWATISTGSASTHTCGVTTTGAGYCWGGGGSGKLGNGSDANIDQEVPAPVVTPEGVVWKVIEGGTNHTCGLSTAGAAYCWGSDSGGMLGDGTDLVHHSSPSLVQLPPGVVLTSLSAASTTNCALATTGAAYCWGSDGFGQLGNGPDITGSQYVPTLVVAPDGVTWASIVAGASHTCAVSTTGAGYCWGADSNGRLGNGPDPSANQVLPHPMVGGHTWAALSMGNFHNCGRTTAGAAYCWGNAAAGRVGGGIDQQQQDAPAAVATPPALASQGITFPALSDRLTTDAPFDVTATASSALPVTLTANGVCTLAGVTVTITGSGTCTVTATQSGDATWAAATPVERSFTVTTPIPSLAITEAPRPLTSATSATIEFTVGPTSGLDVHCRFDGDTWSVCTSPATDEDLAEGSHTFEVRARYPGGDWVVASTAWTIDADPSQVDRRLASLTSQWLASRLPEVGAFVNPLGGTLPDYGLTIDALIAMYASHDGELADPIVELLDDEEHAGNYFTFGGLVPDDPRYENVIVAGATAKVLVAALVSGRDPHDFGGWDMAEETLGTIVTTDVDPSGSIAGYEGRIRDYSKLPELANTVFNNANMFGQSLAVIALAGAGEPFGPDDPAGQAVAALVRQQCSEGYVRIFFSTEPFTDPERPAVTARTQSCDEGKATGTSPTDGDTTGFALSAFLAAKRAGATGLDEPIARAVTWLEDNQDVGGGWGGGVGTEAPNSNSTGLIVQALAEAGAEPAVVARGAAYLESLLVTSAAAGSGGMKDHVGAIAYNASGYQGALSAGSISGMDTWIRASAQASLGIAQVGFYDLVTGNVPDPGPGPDPDPDPEPEPEPEPETTPPPGGTNPLGQLPDDGNGGYDGYRSGSLPRTGTAPSTLVLAGLALVLIGAAVVRTGRTRRDAPPGSVSR